MLAVTCPGCKQRTELLPVATVLAMFANDYGLDGGECLICHAQFQFGSLTRYMPAMRAAQRTALRLQQEGA